MGKKIHCCASSLQRKRFLYWNANTRLLILKFFFYKSCISSSICTVWSLASCFLSVPSSSQSASTILLVTYLFLESSITELLPDLLSESDKKFSFRVGMDCRISRCSRVKWGCPCRERWDPMSLLATPLIPVSAGCIGEMDTRSWLLMREQFWSVA